MPDPAKWQGPHDFVAQVPPEVRLAAHNTANNLFGFALQLYSFYTPDEHQHPHAHLSGGVDDPHGGHARCARLHGPVHPERSG